ncbi:multicopper oxidase family protein [Mycobacterium kyorinense]|uniref:Oxidase n=1 Tax=Mycobacterium kyorinense TaxID=487514 RepID=A0A1X1Y9Q3_9MYCO|nr:multicopper oxidase family protein [Mycobacterium kyorinense]ORW07740.1 oxidase [Mycobacterium kyorinense]
MRGENQRDPSSFDRTQLSRRGFVAATIAGGLALAGCGRSADRNRNLRAAINAAEAARPHSGRTVTASVTPQPATIDLGGTLVRTLAYGNAIPGPLIRANVGDALAITVANRLAHPTSVHWHGIAIRNDMDGAAPATPDIEAGREFTYRFSLPDPGTYWAHPHAGLDADHGMYLPVIVDDPNEAARYDGEWIVVLDDWTDGIGKTPQQIYEALRRPTTTMHDMPGMDAMPGRSAAGASALLGGDAGDVSYPYYLINGRIPNAPSTYRAKPGQRIRIRIINAGSDTAFRVALAAHRMTVTHTDGYPVQPTDVDALLIGMGERYDVIVTAGDGIFPLVALAEGKNALGRALLATGAGSPPEPGFQPPELGGRVGTVDIFTATPAVDLGAAHPNTVLNVDLGGSMSTYVWTINGRPYPDNSPLAIQEGQRATLAFTNNGPGMWHPMHLHGHTFQLIKPDGSRGARKDTINVLPKQKLRVELIADNPGIWMLHCHNTYHKEAGMMTSLNYTT